MINCNSKNEIKFFSVKELSEAIKVNTRIASQNIPFLAYKKSVVDFLRMHVLNNAPYYIGEPVLYALTQSPEFKKEFANICEQIREHLLEYKEDEPIIEFRIKIGDSEHFILSSPYVSLMLISLCDFLKPPQKRMKFVLDETNLAWSNPAGMIRYYLSPDIDWDKCPKAINILREIEERKEHRKRFRTIFKCYNTLLVCAFRHWEKMHLLVKEKPYVYHEYAVFVLTSLLYSSLQYGNEKDVQRAIKLFCDHIRKQSPYRRNDIYSLFELIDFLPADRRESFMECLLDIIQHSNLQDEYGKYILSGVIPGYTPTNAEFFYGQTNYIVTRHGLVSMIIDMMRNYERYF